MAPKPDEGSRWGTNHGLSLYADYLPSKNDATSNAPGTGPSEKTDKSQDASASKQRIQAPFQNQFVKRPQPKAKPQPKNKKPVFFSAERSSPAASGAVITKPSTVPAAPRKTFEDYLAERNDDADLLFPKQKHQRGGRKNRNKKRKEEEAEKEVDWDEIYDLSKPNTYKKYRGSLEKADEKRDWKNHLHTKFKPAKWKTVETAKRHGSSEERKPTKKPPNYAFAPPSFDDPPEPPVPAQDAATAQSSQLPPPPPPPLPSSDASSGNVGEPMQIDIPTTNTTANQPKTSYSAAPVRYNVQPVPTKQDSSPEEATPAPAPDTEADTSTRPGKKGFAQRMMDKWGHQKGSGLGATGEGIINPLSVRPEKRKKRSDSEDGGYRNRAAMGTIVGGKKKKVEGTEEADESHKISQVVLLRGMLTGVDLDAENIGELQQEIGDELNKKYGVVERVFFHRGSTETSTPVFVKFTSDLSALRARDGLQGRNFGGNTISACFFNEAKFERGEYET